jgi:hypothetical protein
LTFKLSFAEVPRSLEGHLRPTDSLHRITLPPLRKNLEAQKANVVIMSEKSSVRSIFKIGHPKIEL